MIYFVEDDANIRKLVCYALDKEGFDVSGFEHPYEFWQKLYDNAPNLILLDIMLPEEDGLSILSKLQADERYKNIPSLCLLQRAVSLIR